VGEILIQMGDALTGEWQWGKENLKELGTTGEENQENANNTSNGMAKNTEEIFEAN
jgi:hypothetical protein